MRKGGSDELLLGKALNELVRWCHLNRIDINSNHNAVNDDIKNDRTKSMWQFLI